MSAESFYIFPYEQAIFARQKMMKLMETILVVLRPAVMTRGVMEPVGSQPASRGDLGNSLNLAKKKGEFSI